MSLSCKICEAFFETEVKFCTHCGVKLTKEQDAKNIETINTIIGFYAVMLVFIAVVYFIGDAFSENLVAELIIEATFAAIILIFSILDYKPILKLYTFKTTSWKLLAFSIIIPLITGVTVYYFVDFIEYLLVEDEESLNYYASYLYLDNPLFWSIFFIAILPPIFEELAFRGFLYNKLLEVTSVNVTIIATAFLFAIIHFSFISFLWIFPFGLLLGYLRFKYRTLWLGMIIHFFHNLTVLLLDMQYYYSLYN